MPEAEGRRQEAGGRRQEQHLSPAPACCLLLRPAAYCRLCVGYATSARGGA
jgi:hypothetical protein